MMDRRRAILAFIGIVGFAAVARSQPARSSNPVITPPSELQPHSPSIQLPSHPGLIDRLDNAIDRGNGRIEEQQIYELRRLQLLEDERDGRIAPLTQAQRFELDHDREMRIEDMIRRLRKQAAENAQRAELDRRQRELLKLAPLPGGGLAPGMDQKALNVARDRRDAQIAQADRDRSIAIQTRPADREKTESEYSQRLAEINRQYDRDRERIFGMPPTTQP
jgi:hypothetical protein